MHDLSYFNLGFRSESVSSFLNHFKDGESPDDYLLEDAVMIISDCLKVKNENSVVSVFSGGAKGYENQTLLPLLAELYSNRKLTDVIDELKAVYSTITRIKTDKTSASNLEYQKAITFFKTLSKLCLSNSIYQMTSEKLAFV